MLGQPREMNGHKVGVVEEEVTHGDESSILKYGT
jgi:hypothetical protein